jgi:hypothetical protein
MALTISSLEGNKQIHRPNLSEVMLLTMQPEVLSITLSGGHLLW